MRLEAHCSGHKIIATDCSYIPKSGKETPHIGKFWSGCASKALKGLEISSLLYTGESSKGRKKKYDGKMNCKQIDGLSKFRIVG
ncbi:MAG: hypothetical protein HQK68_07865 [Desulfamplus sp.]|nr:hypothetical protein [Desulfamplus sp.]